MVCELSDSTEGRMQNKFYKWEYFGDKSKIWYELLDSATSVTNKLLVNLW